MTLTRLCAVFLAAQLAFAPLMAQMPAASSERDYSIGPDTWPSILHAFRMPDEPYVEEGNSPRLDELIHDGKLYLSLSDAIALALENNLDVAVSRFSRKIAETQLLRAKTGGAVSGVQGGVSAASTGASSAATSGVAGRGPFPAERQPMEGARAALPAWAPPGDSTSTPCFRRNSRSATTAPRLSVISPPAPTSWSTTTLSRGSPSTRVFGAELTVLFHGPRDALSPTPFARTSILFRLPMCVWISDNRSFRDSAE